jgi:hypothetical protein
VADFEQLMEELVAGWDSEDFDRFSDAFEQAREELTRIRIKTRPLSDEDNQRIEMRLHAMLPNEILEDDDDDGAT